MIKYGKGDIKRGATLKDTCLYIALQLAQEETLFDFITQIDGAPFSENLAVVFFEQFILGLQAIHLAGSCHRDIKCENIFLDKNFNLKIADFGFSAPIKGKTNNPELSGKLTSYLGTPGQIAPEILKLKPNEGYSGQLVDIFNAGIILFCMVLQKMPFADAKDDDLNYKWVVRDNAE
jgi:serine/threonine protein kinase